MRTRARAIARISGQLASVDHGRLVDVERDGAVQLARVLQQLDGVYAGERRIMVSGDKGVLKSTTTELLLGGAVALDRGPHPVTAVATEFHLIQGPATGVEDPHVLFLTQGDMERRLARVIDDHDRSALQKQGMQAKEVFGYGTEVSLEEFTRRGGGLSIDTLGPALIDRVVRPVAVPRKIWDLSWAHPSRVVLVDTPGARAGGALEDQVRFEQRGRAHVSLELVESSGAIAGRPIDIDCPRILVLTKVDGVAGLDQDGAPRAVAEAIAATRRQATIGSIPVVAICPQWAFDSGDTWRAFDGTAEADDHWARGMQARERWNKVQWPPSPPEVDDLRRAIRESMTDGGFAHLRRAISDEASSVASQIDELRIGQLEAKVVTIARGIDSTPLDQGAQANRLSVKEKTRRRRLLERDETMFDRLRSEVAQAAGDEIYTEPAWEEIVGSFDLDGVWDFGDVAGLGRALGQVNLERIGHSVVAELVLTLERIATEWLAENGLSPDQTIALPQDWGRDVVGHFARIGGRILKSIDRLDLEDRPPTMREMARARHEVSLLLGRMLINAAHPYLEAVREHAAEQFRHKAGDRSGSNLSTVVNSVIAELSAENAEEVA